MLELKKLKKIRPENAKELIPKLTGIYFWFYKNTDELIYIGTGSGRYGLFNRIIRQHLNPKYIEYRAEKHSPLDSFQLGCQKKKIVKGQLKVGIDQSAFRKNIGRNLKIPPGEGTVNYILEHFYLKYYLVDNIPKLKELEKEMIKKHSPKFNISHKYKISNRRI